MHAPELPVKWCHNRRVLPTYEYPACRERGEHTALRVAMTETAEEEKHTHLDPFVLRTRNILKNALFRAE
jgi:hypothetical protein